MDCEKSGEIANEMFAAYEVSQDRVLLDEAIDNKMRTIVNSDLSLQPARLKWLWKLSLMLSIRFQSLGDVNDLKESISYERLAVKQTPDGDADKPVLLNNLGESFRSRFEHLGDVSDIEAAISYGRLAVDSTPDDGPNKPVFLNLFYEVGPVCTFWHLIDDHSVYMLSAVKA